MLVFGFLKRRNFQERIQKQCKRRCYGCDIHSVGVRGAFLPLHTLCGLIYTQRGYLFARLIQMVFPTTTESGWVKVQMPAFFVCGR